MKYEEHVAVSIEKSDLPKTAQEYAQKGYRLVQICCLKSADNFELLYSFDKDYKMTNVGVKVSVADATLPSITDSFLAAFTYENELQDLFGFTVDGLKINYKGRFYATAKKAVFASSEADNQISKNGEPS